MTPTPWLLIPMNTSPCPEPEPKGSGDSLSPPGSKSRHWSRLLPLPRWMHLGATFLHFGALGCTLLGSGHGAVFGDLLLWTASSRELVVVLELAKTLRNALCREPGLRVVVPALNKSFAHHLDALQRAQREQPWWGQSPPKPMCQSCFSALWSSGVYSCVSWRCFMGSAATVGGVHAFLFFFFFKETLLQYFQHFNCYCHFWACVLIPYNKKKDALDYRIK